jgi:hypothetical protein
MGFVETLMKKLAPSSPFQHRPAKLGDGFSTKGIFAE